jgi:hypothetical protein
MQATSATDDGGAVIDGDSGLVITYPPAKKRAKHIKLESVRDVRTELARVYRAARSGDIPVDEASKFTFMLGTLGKLIVDSEIEQRIEQLEGKHEPE